jgi:putative transcriptional regulator
MFVRVPDGSERRTVLNAYADIPRLVRLLRERTGLTQEKFAAKLGVTFPTINRWENGRAKPSPLALKQIEDLLLDLGEQGRDLLDEFFKRARD